MAELCIIYTTLFTYSMRNVSKYFRLNFIVNRLTVLCFVFGLSLNISELSDKLQNILMLLLRTCQY